MQLLSAHSLHNHKLCLEGHTGHDEGEHNERCSKSKRHASDRLPPPREGALARNREGGQVRRCPAFASCAAIRARASVLGVLGATADSQGVQAHIIFDEGEVDKEGAVAGQAEKVKEVEGAFGGLEEEVDDFLPRGAELDVAARIEK